MPLPAPEDVPRDVAGDDTSKRDDVTQELVTAKQAFLDACDSYEATGSRLEQDVIKQLAPYHDPAYDRAQIIRVFGRDLSEQIQSFSRTRQRELSQVAMLTLNFSVTTGALANAILRDALNEMNAKNKAVRDRLAAMHDPSQPPGETGVKEADAVEPAKQRATLAAAIDRVGEEMIWAYRIATYVVELRQGELDSYLQNVPLVDRTSDVRKALVIAIAKQATLKAVEFGAGGPIVAALVTIIEARNEVREKVEAMTAHYERGPLDEMFELAQAIDDEQQIHTAVEEMLDGVATFLNQAQSEFSGSKRLGRPTGTE